MLEKLEQLQPYIGNTPLIKLESDTAHLYAKLEYTNFSGSMKDRAAYSIISHGIKTGKINRDTTIIASSSGNLAIAAASICRILKLKFIPVIDPNINPSYEALLNIMSYKVMKVTKRDNTGGYLLTRIDTVNNTHASIPNSFIADQYADPYNYKGYYGMADELAYACEKLDYVFLSVSSSGSITGLSSRIKQQRPDVRIVAVDVEGSVIFNQPPTKRYISGIGASQRPPIIEQAIIDDVIIVSQAEIVRGCQELLADQAIFAGASSGAVYMAYKKYFTVPAYEEQKPSVVMIFPDKGFTYLDNVYNQQWVEQHNLSSVLEEELIQ